MTEDSTARLTVMLADLSVWAPSLGDVNAAVLGLHSPRFALTGPGAPDILALPFGLDRTQDDDEAGAAGVRTEGGVLDHLGAWARSIAGDRREQVVPDVYTYLSATLHWAVDHTDFDALAETIRDAWAAVATITGHTPQNLGDCPLPGCGGTVQAPTGERGRDTSAWCDTCDTWFPEDYRDHLAHLVPALRHRMRSATVSADARVTLATLVMIWEPEVSDERMRQWAKRGHLIRVGSGRDATYNLRLSNMWIEQRLAA